MARAIDRYLERHAERIAQRAPDLARWDNVLVVPCYREPPEMLAPLRASFDGAGRLLVILVLNRPDSDPDVACNAPLRDAVLQLPRRGVTGAALFRIADATELLLLDLDRDGPLPAGEAVGLARKTGCDLALR